MRKKRVYKKYRKPDPTYLRIDMGRFINYVMRDGKKSIAQRVVYNALLKVRGLTKEDPLKVFEKAVENASPQLEVISKRIGGANYQIPHEVPPERRFVLAIRWIIAAARSKKGKPMEEKIAEELIAASKNEGAAIKKKQDTHRMAEANRAFAHFLR